MPVLSGQSTGLQIKRLVPDLVLQLSVGLEKVGNHPISQFPPLSLWPEGSGLQGLCVRVKAKLP